MSVNILRRFWRSVWVFPVIALVPVIFLSALQIHGSSMGAYHNLFYGAEVDDPALLLNTPKPIRSDEWFVNTQMVLSQNQNDFRQINEYVGNGEDVSLLVDVPYKDWSIIFKPHHLGYFVFSFATAFALSWWSMAYLLVVSVYFFVLTLMPKKRLLAALIASSLVFSPFIHWWYLHGTLGTLYFGFFAATAFLKILHSKSVQSSIAWVAMLAYSLTAFALILYPPFQFSAAVVWAVIGCGFLIEYARKAKKKEVLQKLGFVAISVLVAVGVIFTFVSERRQTINTIQNTAYPGQREVDSGGYDPVHLVSSHLSARFQSEQAAQLYVAYDTSRLNQSSTSNFILVLPLLLLPGVWLLLRDHAKRRVTDWALVGATVLTVVLVFRLFVPYFDPVFDVLLFDLVPIKRLNFGVGLLSTLYFVLIIRHLVRTQKVYWSRRVAVLYSLATLIVSVAISFYVQHRSTGFLRLPLTIGLSLPLPFITYLTLNKRFHTATGVFLAFSIISTAMVMPLYRGLDIITETPLSQEIRKLSAQNDGRWASEGFINHPVLNGARSLSGTYTYPQKEIWQSISADENIYNRYAHISFDFDRDPAATTEPDMQLLWQDSISISIEPCDEFLTEQKVSFLMTLTPLSDDDSCITELSEVNYPLQTIYFYQLERN